MTISETKKASYYTPGLTKALKRSDRIMCGVSDAGRVFVSNGFFICSMTAAEYDAFVRPVTHRDPGAWDLQTSSGTATITAFDLPARFTREASGADYIVYASPLLAHTEHCDLLPYYSSDGGFTVALNVDLALIVSEKLPRCCHSSKSSVVVYAGSDPLCAILPVRIKDAGPLARAARAWFTPPADPTPASDSDDLTAQLTAAREALEAATRERDDLAAQLAAAREALEAASRERNALTAQLTAAQESPAPAPADHETAPDKTAAIVVAVSALGLACTVKGAHTAAPVVWIDGDAAAHKTELEQIGARFSAKRSAYYISAR